MHFGIKEAIKKESFYFSISSFYPVLLEFDSTVSLQLDSLIFN